MKSLKTLPLILSSLYFITAYAANINITLPVPAGNRSFDSLVGTIFTGITAFGLAVAPIIIVWGGYEIMTAAGNAEKVKTGRKAILYASIGLAGVILAQVVVALVKELVTGAG